MTFLQKHINSAVKGAEVTDINTRFFLSKHFCFRLPGSVQIQCMLHFRQLKKAFVSFHVSK